MTPAYASDLARQFETSGFADVHVSTRRAGRREIVVVRGTRPV